MAREGLEASIENPSEGERCTAGLSSTSEVRTGTHGTSISFAVKDQKILKEKLQPERDPSPLPPASRPSTVWVCPWLTQGLTQQGTATRVDGQAPGHTQPVSNSDAMWRGLKRQHPPFCSGVWRQHWAALDEVLRVLGSIQENGGSWMDTQLPANEGSGRAISWKSKRCPYLYLSWRSTVSS